MPSTEYHVLNTVLPSFCPALLFQLLQDVLPVILSVVSNSFNSWACSEWGSKDLLSLDLGPSGVWKDICLAGVGAWAWVLGSKELLPFLATFSDPVSLLIFLPSLSVSYESYNGNQFFACSASMLLLLERAIAASDFLGGAKSLFCACGFGQLLLKALSPSSAIVRVGGPG